MSAIRGVGKIGGGCGRCSWTTSLLSGVAPSDRADPDGPAFRRRDRPRLLLPAPRGQSLSLPSPSWSVLTAAVQRPTATRCLGECPSERRIVLYRRWISLEQSVYVKRCVYPVRLGAAPCALVGVVGERQQRVIAGHVHLRIELGGSTDDADESNESRRIHAVDLMFTLLLGKPGGWGDERADEGTARTCANDRYVRVDRTACLL